jgi:hypothetical protein
MSDAKTYQGSCHCGKVKFEATADLSGEMISCNCSLCGRTGALLAFVPKTAFKLLSGDDALTDYQFNKKTIHHYFCSTCGVRSFAAASMPDGTEMRALNVRCLEGVDPKAVKLKHYDGASH